MTRFSEGTNGRLDALRNGDCLRGFVIRRESATSRKKVARRTEGRGEGHAEDRERATRGERMNFSAGVREVALGICGRHSLRLNSIANQAPRAEK